MSGFGLARLLRDCSPEYRSERGGLSVAMFAGLFGCALICPPGCLADTLPVSLSVCLHPWLAACRSVWLAVRQSVCVQVGVPVRLSVPIGPIGLSISSKRISDAKIALNPPPCVKIPPWTISGTLFQFSAFSTQFLLFNLKKNRGPNRGQTPPSVWRIKG